MVFTRKIHTNKWITAYLSTLWNKNLSLFIVLITDILPTKLPPRKGQVRSEKVRHPKTDTLTTELSR